MVVKRIPILFTYILLSVPFVGCSDNENDGPPLQQTDCDAFARISRDGYDGLNGNTFQITEATISGDCLAIRLEAGGLCKDVSVHLFDSGAIAESNPEQRFLRLIFDTNDAVCNEFFEKEISYDLRDLQLENGSGEVLLNLEGWDSPLSYQY